MDKIDSRASTSTKVEGVTIANSKHGTVITEWIKKLVTWLDLGRH
jgi:hypothetical protein